MIFVHPTVSDNLFCDHKRHRNMRKPDIQHAGWFTVSALATNNQLRLKATHYGNIYQRWKPNVQSCCIGWNYPTPHPHPSLSTLGGVKSTLDEELQLNTVWFADSALLRFPRHAEHPPPPPTPHLLSHDLVSSRLPHLSCSPKIPLPSNTQNTQHKSW